MARRRVSLGIYSNVKWGEMEIKHRAFFLVIPAMRLLLILSIFLVAACSFNAQPQSNRSRPTMAIFDFNTPNPAEWHIQNDGVMGGKSSGFMDFSDGALKFTGEVVTEGGGFTSVLATKSFDFSEYAGVEVRVRGGGRTFEFAIDDGIRSQGREVWRQVPFTPTKEWTWIKLPFERLAASVHGEPYDAPMLNKDKIEKIGFYIIDGQDGPFRLEVDEIRGY